MEEASYLAGLCSKVTLLHRRDEFRACKVMQERVVSNPKIEVLRSHVVTDVLGTEEDRVTGLRVKDVKSGAERQLPVGALFVAIGHTPMTDLFRGQLDLHDNGYIKVKLGSTYTSVPGVFAAGDVADWTYRQAVTAAGTGCMAALDAERWLGEVGAH
jgi:thioredoxin reductase (NADPH)